MSGWAFVTRLIIAAAVVLFWTRASSLIVIGTNNTTELLLAKAFTAEPLFGLRRRLLWRSIIKIKPRRGVGKVKDQIGIGVGYHCCSSWFELLERLIIELDYVFDTRCACLSIAVAGERKIDTPDLGGMVL